MYLLLFPPLYLGGVLQGQSHPDFFSYNREFIYMYKVLIYIIYLQYITY